MPINVIEAVVDERDQKIYVGAKLKIHEDQPIYLY